MSQAYYIAIIPPPNIRTKVHELKTHLANQYHTHAALRSPAHITLHPPFELNKQNYQAFEQVVTRFCTQQLPFSLTLKDFGSFPSNRVIYINCLATTTLMSLREQLRERLHNALGITHPSFAHQSFHPHITIALYDLSVDHYPSAWARFEQQSFQESFEVSQLAILKKRENCWEIFREYTFGGK